MRRRIRHILFQVAGLLAQPLRLIPWTARRNLLRGLLFAESRLGTPSLTLSHLFALQDDLDRLLSERATAYGGGVNPKHRLTGYHDFFVAHIPEIARVLDVGCGIGAVARSIADRRPKAQVAGIDADPEMLRQARAMPCPVNLTFIEGDATKHIPAGSWDVVVLSNVLEHIEHRVEFLKAILIQARPSVLLIRVPLFERHWQMPLRRELGVDFRSDPTHWIEHTLEEFNDEMSKAGLRIAEQKLLWGEIWAKLERAL